jgi:hypothetical protein
MMDDQHTQTAPTTLVAAAAVVVVRPGAACLLDEREMLNYWK